MGGAFGDLKTRFNESSRQIVDLQNRANMVSDLENKIRLLAAENERLNGIVNDLQGQNG